MIEVAQTKFGKDEGNCLSACIASLLELPIEEVPSFLDEITWKLDLNKWLAPRGWFYLECGWKNFPRIMATPIYCIAGGPSPRDRSFEHCVVGRIDNFGDPDDDATSIEVVWDPHPDGTDLVHVNDVGFLIPVDPANPGIGPTMDGAESDSITEEGKKDG
jgi:hypothetical protein